jgi:hypothetical protein
MRLTDKPHFSPHRCAAIPFIGQTNPDTRWIDTGQELDREHVYLSDHAIREAIRLLDWATPEEHDALKRQTAELAHRVMELEEQLTEMEGVVGAIDVIESADFRARRRAGRPKKRPEETAA